MMASRSSTDAEDDSSSSKGRFVVADQTTSLPAQTSRWAFPFTEAGYNPLQDNEAGDRQLCNAVQAEKRLANGGNEEDTPDGGGVDDDAAAGYHSKICARGHWRPAEDSKLKELVALYGPQNWNQIAEKLEGRSGNILFRELI